MSNNILLVPITIDAFYADGKVQLAAPLADFTSLPYFYATPPTDNKKITEEIFNDDPPPPPASGVNGDNTFLSDTVFRAPEPGSNKTWTPSAGLHLHWALPDALTTQRVHSGTDGKSLYPQVPNRWLVVLSTKTGNTWSQQNSWVIESDYLYPDQQMCPVSCGSTAISFPIISPQAFNDILASPVPPSQDPLAPDFDAHPFFYKAPFRCMGRCLNLSTWQADSVRNEYLSDYNQSGLSAIGYGHPLFAAIYSNCFSVFGFHDDLSIGGYPRRYDLIGWYDNSDNDSMALFQNLSCGANPWDALKSEYNWVNAGTAVDAVPAQSVYYSRLEIDAAFSNTSSLPKSDVVLTVGNTATEALSAYLAQSFEQSDTKRQITLEEQLEAICLAPKLAGENIDFKAKFIEARHDKGFKKVHGGNLWSIRAKKTGSAAPKQDNEILLPDGFAHLLNLLNSVQIGFDAALDEIDSLRRHVFTDWYLFEYKAFVTEKGSEVSLPSPDDILSYSVVSVLTPLQQRIAATGEVIFGIDPITGKATASVKDNSGLYDVTVQYSLAKQLVQALQNLTTQLGNYNSGQVAMKANLEYYLVRKGAPRFYQPADPVVLLEGEAVTLTERHDADDELNCTVCDIEETGNSLVDSLRADGVSSGAFSTILAVVDTLAQGTAQGFKIQSTQPWNPITIEWAAKVWPETAKTATSPTGEGIAYAQDYIDGIWELDVNDADLKLKSKPSQLVSAETPYSYAGRSILVSHAPKSLQNSIGIYMMPLSLADLKVGGLRGVLITDDVDYNYDLALFTWAGKMFSGIQTPPVIQPPSSLSPEQLAQQKSMVSVWLSQQMPFVSKLNDKTVLVDLVALMANHSDWYMTRPVIADNGSLIVFSTLTISMQTQDPLFTAVNAYLAVHEKTLLSQALSGFNDALLTQQREFQLPVWDWRVTSDVIQNAYVRDIALNIGNIKVGPIFDDAFLPIRSGLMQISGLTIVDSFGQVLPLTPTITQKSERMTILNNLAYNIDPSTIATANENDEYIYLAPRFTQESRLNFRWLSADQGNDTGLGDEQEMNDHPVTTPVCGWILPNNLDHSLAVYANDGTALGSLVEGTDNTGKFAIAWESAPGTNDFMPLSQLPNPHLFDFATNIIATYVDQTTWESFLSDINLSLQTIDPKSFAQQSGLSLLIARPMALVRATVGLQAKGLPAVNHAVEAFVYNQAHNLFNRLTNGFDNVVIPIRLGERAQLNDGLVAYWVEDSLGGYQNNQAYFPEEEGNGPTMDYLSMTISGDPCKITMLLDPRGVVHATCGMLPVKSLSIPPEQYASVLSKLSVTFLTSPLITPLETVQFPLPVEPGYGWSWLDKPTGFTWNRVADIGNTSREAVYEQQRILEGWLKLTPQIEKQTS